MTKTELAERFDAACAGLAGAASYVMCMAGTFSCLGIWIWQGFAYLKRGAWPAFTTIDLTLFFYGDAAPGWLLWPQQWLGLHKILSTMPGALALLIGGLVAGGILSAISHSLKE